MFSERSFWCYVANRLEVGQSGEKLGAVVVSELRYKQLQFQF